MNEPINANEGFSGFSIKRLRAELTQPASGFVGFTFLNNRSEFIQQVRGFKGFSVVFTPPGRTGIGHLVPRS